MTSLLALSTLGTEMRILRPSSKHFENLEKYPNIDKSGSLMTEITKSRRLP